VSRLRGRGRRRVGGTHVLGALAVGGTVAAVVLEYVHVWRRGSAPLLDEVEGVNRLAAGAEAALETVEVAVEGYRGGSYRENALLNLLVSFSLTLGATRLSTHVRNVSVGRRHIHHFVPGIALAFVAGGVSILSRDEALDPWLALPFGAGAALTLDESALLLVLDDVYWTEEGVVSVQIALGAMALLSAAAVALRMLRRGERQVLGSRSEPVGSAL
jgi:hypothetical protein